MKTLKITVADRLYQLETGPEAQVGDQVKLTLDQAAIPDLPEFVFGIIQHPIKRVGNCGDSTLYTIEYTLADYTLRDDDVLEIVTTSAVDVVANDLLDEETARIAADTAEATARAAADTTLQANIDTEEAARIAADALKQDDLTDIGNVDVGSTTGASFGNATTQKVGFHGAAVVQRAGAAQIAVPTTVLTVSDPPTQAEVQAVIDRLALVTTLANELRASDVEKGIIKGSA